MKQNGVELQTSLSLSDSGRVVNQAFSRAKASVQSIAQSSNPLDGLDGQADLAVVGMRQGLMNQWAVQVYLTGQDGGTQILLVALGDGAGNRMMNGAKNSTSLAKSTAQMRQMIEAVRAADPDVREL